MAGSTRVYKSVKPLVEDVTIVTSQLVKILSEDKQLGEDKTRLQLFLSLAKLFDSELKINLTLTSFELDDKYQTHDPHTWLEFKNYIPVRKYISAYLDEDQLTQARKMLAQEGITRTKDAMDVQALMESKNKQDQNTNIIIMFMPQKEYNKIK